MAHTVPTSEPVSVRAGDTWTWTRSLPDYPATDWTLTYTLWTADGVVSIVASADGATHAVDVPPATTAAYAAGRYTFFFIVRDCTEIYTVGTGVMQVLPAVGAAQDTRTHARTMLDAINAMIEGRASDGDLDVVRTSIGGRDTEWDLETLLKMRQQYAASVAAEDAAQRVARGEGSGRMVQVRFVG